MSKGKLIVIDGIDGSGKATQVDLLLERLNKEGYQSLKVDFPKHGEKSAGLVDNYLNGKYGTANEVNPFVASFFYALDRFDSKKEMEEWLTSGKNIVSNRYVTANMGHQGSKFATAEKRQVYFQWLDNYEYNVFGIPRPDLNIILHVPAALAQELIGNKQQRLYANGKTHDMHEADIEHLRRAEETYLEMCRLFPNYELVECVRNGEMMSVEEIHELVWEKAQKLIILAFL